MYLRQAVSYRLAVLGWKRRWGWQTVREHQSHNSWKNTMMTRQYAQCPPPWLCPSSLWFCNTNSDKLPIPEPLNFFKHIICVHQKSLQLSFLVLTTGAESSCLKPVSNILIYDLAFSLSRRYRGYSEDSRIYIMKKTSAAFCLGIKL